MLGRTLWEIGPFRDVAASKTAFAELQRKDYIRYDSLPLETKDGRSVAVEFVSNAYVVASHNVIQCNIRDITDRKRAEARIAYLNRLYMMLSAVNETVVRERDEHALLEAVCRIAIDQGGFRMAWIGMLDANRRVVVPVAAAGVPNGYLDSVNIDLASAERSAGPAGRCVASGDHQVSDDIATDPAMAPWRDAALERGYASCGAFPVKVANRVVGALTLYAGRPGAFDSGIVALRGEAGFLRGAHGDRYGIRHDSGGAGSAI